MTTELLWMLPCVFVAAVLYSAVGHGGASGYLAVMALFGLAPEVMRPSALTMNIFVTLLVLMRVRGKIAFDWRIFLSFAVASVPMAYLGGRYSLDAPLYNLLIAGALLLAAWQLMRNRVDPPVRDRPSVWIAVPVGTGLGFLSGLTGVGGGIFLSPLLLWLRWSNMSGSVPIAAAFILVNSLAGLIAVAGREQVSTTYLPLLVACALGGAALGSELTVRRLNPVVLRRVLAAVLLIAATKLMI